MSSSDVAREKAARLLKKRGSTSSMTSTEVLKLAQERRKMGCAGEVQRSISTISYLEEPGQDENSMRPLVRMENTFQLGPNQRFPDGVVRSILKDVLVQFLEEEKYEPELCREMTKTISEVVKARVKDLDIPRYKIITLIHIGELNDQGMRIGSRCAWDASNDTFASFEFRNNSLFAIGTVYGVYTE